MTHLNNIFLSEPLRTDALGWLDGSRLSEESVESKEATRPRVLLVDDDPIFCRTMQKIAKKYDIPLTVCESLHDIVALPSHLPFDVLAVDYFFGDIRGTQLSHLLGDNAPVLLISNSDKSKLMEQSWPEYIRAFVSKKEGPKSIFREAFTLLGHSDPFLAMKPVSAHPLENHREEKKAILGLIWLGIIAMAFLGVLMSGGSSRGVAPASIQQPVVMPFPTWAYHQLDGSKKTKKNLDDSSEK